VLLSAPDGARYALRPHARRCACDNIQMAAPTLTDGVVQLDEFGPGDVDAHLANEDEEMARRFGWWPNRSMAHHARAAFDRWSVGS
jgi:hypothetical protein